MEAGWWHCGRWVCVSRVGEVVGPRVACDGGALVVGGEGRMKSGDARMDWESKVGGWWGCRR